MSEFTTVAEAIIQQAGGLDNITSATHCMTRLRLEVRDESLLNREGIQNVDMVKGLNKVGDQYQVILGTGIVNKVYKEVEKIFQENNKVLESGKSGGPLLQRISHLFGDIFIPVIPVIVASGILMGVRPFLTESGMLGITEPAIFGSNLIYLMPFVFGCIGGGFAGMFATWVNLSAPGMGAGCIPGLLYYIGNAGALAEYVISSLIAVGIGFVLTAMFIKKKGI